jgi:hypothetical protein
MSIILARKQLIIKTMTEKQMILTQWGTRHSLMTPLRNETTNPLARFFNGLVKLINRITTP